MINLFIFIILSIIAPHENYEPISQPVFSSEISLNDHISDLWTSFAQLQRSFQQKLTNAMKQVREKLSLKVILLIVLISVVYGVIHALGPGHGKMLISSYYLNRESKVLSAVKIGTIVAFTHCGLALIIGLVFGLFLKGSGFDGRENIQNILSIMSGVLISLLGIVYIIINIPKIHDKMHNFYQKSSNDVLIGILSGMVPCPISMTVILFSVYMEIIWVGVLSVISLSIGMAITVALVGILVIKTKDSILSKVSNKKFGQKAHLVLSITGAIFILIIGIVLTVNSLT